MLDLLLYSSIRDYIYARISYFAEHVLSQNLTLALTIILALLTLWVMIQGYMLATGRSQEGLKGFVYSLGKSYLIVAIALGVAGSGSFGVRTLTDTLSDGISQIMTGDNDAGSECLTQKTQIIIGCKIDRNLKATQSMISSLTAIDTADDDYLEEKLTQAKWFAGVGTAGPAIVAGTLLIVFRIAMSLFIGFAPIFILCLLFKRTAPLFQKWLYYGLATIFSSVMLGVMADISMDLVFELSKAEVASNLAAIILNSQSPTGIMQTVTQQLGLGLLLSALLITVPPMAGLWFNGVMGHYNGYNAMAGWNGGVPATPPGMNNYQQQVDSKANHHYQQIAQHQQTETHNTALGHGTRINASTAGQSTDTLKSSNAQLQQSLGTRVLQPKHTEPEKEEKKS